MPNEQSHPVDNELVRLKAAALDAGHLKLATWGTKRDLQYFLETGRDKFRHVVGD